MSDFAKDINVPTNDLIRRQDAIDALEAKKDKTAKGNIGQFYNTIIQHDIDTLIDLPTVDAVDVVRCKDCIHFKPFRPTVGLCKISGRMNVSEFFCADGERKCGE